MIPIGDFARLGDVSLRMLRHYDRIGLLVPAHVDPWTGYRSYGADQLSRLHRLVALKDLGFTLAQVGELLDGAVDAGTLRRLLEEREAALEREHAEAERRLDGVRARLRLVHQEDTMTVEIIRKSLPAVRLAACTATVGPDQRIGDVVEPCFDRAQRAVEQAGGSLATAIGVYDSRVDGMHVVAGFGWSGDEAPTGTEIVELDTVDEAVCGVHVGPMSAISATWQALLSQVEALGLEPLPGCREDYVRAESADQHDWVVELQQPVRPRG